MYAMEHGRIIELAREVIRSNGFEDRIVLVQGTSSEIELPERVDLIIANIGFSLTLDYMVDARQRFLKPGGSMIPRMLDLFCVPVESPAAHHRDVGFWKSGPFEMDFHPLWKMSANTVHQGRFTSDQFLAKPALLSRMDLLEVPEPKIGGEANYIVTRPGTFHGLGVWYVLWLNEDITISLAPPLELPYPLWSHLFFPMEDPVQVQPGDRIAAKIDATAFTTAGLYLTWEIRLQGRQASIVSKQSTFQGTPLSLESLRRQDPSYCPSLNPRGQAARMVLDLAEEHQTLESIEQETYRHHSNLFRNTRAAQAFVSQVLKGFGK